MSYAHLPGVHTLPDGSTVDVAVKGSKAELEGTDPRGDASYTLTLPVSKVASLLEGTVA